MEWVDIVHLLLFNLYKIHKKKYLNLKKDIFPYATTNWSSLNLEKSVSFDLRVSLFNFAIYIHLFYRFEIYRMKKSKTIF